MGRRLQYSVFRCRLDHTTLEKLCWELTDLMKNEDDLLVMPICARCTKEFRFTLRVTSRPGSRRHPHSGSCDDLAQFMLVGVAAI